jgi:hypothetical protein
MYIFVMSKNEEAYYSKQSINVDYVVVVLFNQMHISSSTRSVIQVRNY